MADRSEVDCHNQACKPLVIYTVEFSLTLQNCYHARINISFLLLLKVLFVHSLSMHSCQCVPSGTACGPLYN